MEFKLVFIHVLIFLITVNGYGDLIYNRTELFDDELFKEVLDRRECAAQVAYIRLRDPALLGRFKDAGYRFPRSLQKGNVVDIGSYYECLGIEKSVRNMTIEGKFCMVRIPFLQFVSLLPVEIPGIPLSQLSSSIDNNTYNDLMMLKSLESQIQRFSGMTSDIQEGTEEVNPTFDASIRFAVCIPKPCSLENALDFLLKFQPTNLQVEEGYCRLPNDKPWASADYVTVSLFSFLGLLLLLSTSYDIHQQIFLKKDPKKMNKLLQSFSVYTNTRRLMTYTPVAGSLECLDGVRACAMIWVVIGHAYITHIISAPMHNPLKIAEFIQSFWSLWITAAPITVDTFFVISGILLVYSTVGKVTGAKLMKNLHLFYLSRFLRLFPVLATCVLLQASLFHRVSDGPAWEAVAQQTLHCRKSWWPTLLYIQNYYSPLYMCLPHSWYLAIDFQLFIISPFVLYFVVSSNKKTAWITLSTCLIGTLIGATIYNFIMGFKAGPFTLSPIKEGQPDYFTYYYINPLTRSPPFFVGMIFGYILHTYRGKKIYIPKLQVALLWFLALIVSSGILCANYPALQRDWDNQTVDNILNSFMRPLWGLCVCWMVFACVHGYGGPVNWVLCLPMWKVLARLSYAMYIFHYPLMILVNGTSVTPVYMSDETAIRKFMSDIIIAFLTAYIVTMFVDAPCSVLIKYFMGG
ncbi:O-acyltransferase like protein-like [Achroia grisella]|uniref:O-acyltransferase like protein-like n=1 Tax=Achroia grisella TaxID=688607 RepID=UPI0027D24FAC|nr:O-acyltransferase like protein-like [Achroia grisella]